MRRIAFVICLAIGGFAATGTALAGPPTATTLAASAVTATTATLNGIVIRNNEETTYYFEYGTTTAYGSKTPTATAEGNAPTGKAVSADLTGLAPSTTYHFRLVATNPSGTSTGADMVFTTTAAGAPPPGGITIAANPRVVTFGNPVTISGQLAGRPGERVELEEDPFPFGDAFRNAGQTTTDSAANYAFQVTPEVNTRYHVVAKSPPATSADITVLVRTRVGLRLSDRTPAVGQRVRFRGSVRPAHDGSRVRLQRRTSTGWRTIATPLLRAATPIEGVTRSTYRTTMRVRRSGVFRTVMPAHDDHARGKSRKRRAFVQ